MHITSSLAEALTPVTAALGNFDGLHGGHQRVIKPILKRDFTSVSDARSINVLGLDSEPQDRPWRSVVTFTPHPQEFFSGQSKALLTPLTEKAEYLEQMGIEQLVLLPFNRELASLTPVEFVDTILIQQLQAKQISVGQDFCFGQNRSGKAVDLKAIAARYGVHVEIIPLYHQGSLRISSSVIRTALLEGDLDLANQLLGRPYTLTGTVVEGQRLGRTIGFPTANLAIAPNKFLPQQGVYAVRLTTVPSETGAQDTPLKVVPGVMNLGCRPTVNGQQQTIEVHVLNWSGDLYGQTVRIQLEQFLRQEQKFDSLEDLQQQIRHDCDQALRYLETSPSHC